MKNCLPTFMIKLIYSRHTKKIRTVNGGGSHNCKPTRIIFIPIKFIKPQVHVHTHIYIY